MKHLLTSLIVLAAVSLPLISSAKLEFDSKKNNAQLFGPYIKYNALKPPYSFGRYKFKKTDITLELGGIALPANDEGSSDEIAEEPAGKTLYVIWPKFLLNFGTVKLVRENGEDFLDEDFESDDVIGGDKYAHYRIEDQDGLLSKLEKNFRICLFQEYKNSKVTACSDVLKREGSKFLPTRASKENQKSIATLNGQKVPSNAQINIPEKQQTLNLNIEFKSGFKIHVVDKVRRLKIENVAIDPVQRRIGIIGGDGAVSTKSLTFKNRFFKFIKEKNYYRNQFEITQEWPQNLEDAEMEFVPYNLGASAQHYGLVLDQIPPQFKFKIADDSPIATYRSIVEFEGTKAKKEKLTAKRKDELLIHKDETSFLWKFPAPEKGKMHQNYLALKDKGEYYYFSRRVFRAHRGSVSASAALSTTPLLDFSLGYRYAADYWPESVWKGKKWAYQRWGFGFNIYETLDGFKPEADYKGLISINPIHLDIMYRLSPGVRPVQSSFGLALRYLRYQVFRNNASDLTPRLLGFGGFWHAAPQKIVDDVFNIVPFFRYPKWMELSAFYYPLVFGEFNLGFSWSYHAKGRLFFSKDWYFEATFNVMDITFEKVGDSKPRISTAHGTLGFGWMF